METTIKKLEGELTLLDNWMGSQASLLCIDGWETIQNLIEDCWKGKRAGDKDDALPYCYSYGPVQVTVSEDALVIRRVGNAKRRLER